MRKKLDTRFPAARIKKIMQADEDVGKIAMAVPVLVSKALELFLQDLCGRTYDITVHRGAKTVSSLHLKQCVHSYNVFDFLKEVVSKVPDYGNPDAAADSSKRRKIAANESNDSDEETKRVTMQEACHASSVGHASGVGRVRGRGRGRGRGRASSVIEREPTQNEIETTPAIQQCTKQTSSPVPADNGPELNESSKEEPKVVDSNSRNFDLNSGVYESTDKMASTAALAASSASASASSSSAGPSDVKAEDYPALSETDRMAIDPVHLAHIGSRLDEDEEDYDEEG